MVMLPAACSIREQDQSELVKKIDMHKGKSGSSNDWHTAEAAVQSQNTTERRCGGLSTTQDKAEEGALKTPCYSRRVQSKSEPLGRESPPP